MSEIEKMYELAGVEKEYKIHTIDWQSFKEYCYPPFTAEKQITILITLANYNQYEDTKKLLIDSLDGEIYIGFYQDITLTANATDTDFAECVAKLINNIWQDLTEEEHKQIREILE